MALWKQLILAWAVATAAGGETDFFAYATASETNVFLGQVFNLDVIVKAPEPPDAPDWAANPDFHATLLEAGKPTAATNTWFYRFALRAKREGELAIPSLRFGPAASNPVAIQAQKPAATDRMSLVQTLSAPSAFLGEPVLLTTTWDSTYPFNAIKAVDFNFPVLNDARFHLLEPYEPQKESAEQTTGLPVHGTRVLASRRTYAEGETQHQALSFSKILVPKKTGTLTVAPATLLCAADKEAEPGGKAPRRSNAFQYPAYFDNTFFDQNTAGGHFVRIYTESAPLSLEVKPLPAEGRPALFNGMVGEFTIAVLAEPLDVRVGEPVTLTVTVTAAGFMEAIDFPSLRYQPQLANRFEIPSERSLPARSGKSKTYTQTIRPLSTDIDAVPPLQLAYFSPASNRYVVAETAPIPLRVSPAGEIGVFGATSFQSRLRTAEGGIRQNRAGDRLLASGRPLLFGWAHPFAVFAVLLVPPLVVAACALAALFGEKRHHIRRTAKAARAYREFRRNIVHIAHHHRTKREIYGDLDEILRAYLGDRLHLNPGALAFREARERLSAAGVDAGILDRIGALFAVCEAYRFTAGFDGPADAKAIMRDAANVVAAVERRLK